MMVAEEFRFYYYALIVGLLGAAMIGAFIVRKSMYMMFVAGFGNFLVVVGGLILLFAMYREYRETGSIAEAFGF